MGSVYVIGTGGIGLFLQYLLQEEVGSTLVARSPTLATLRSGPLQVTGTLTGSLDLRACALEDLPTLGAADTVFLAVGANDAPPALETLRPRIGEETTVVLCQNAIGMYELGREILGRGRLLRMHCWLGSQKRGPTHIDILGIFKVDLSSAPGDGALVHTWQQSFEACGVPATTGADPAWAEWTKALWTIALHGVCALADAPIGVVQSSQDMRALALGLMEEAVQVASLDGIELAAEDVDDVLTWVGAAPDLINATMRDLEAGRPHDLAFFNGAVVAAAARHGQRAPMNESILRLVNYLEASGKRRRD